MTKLKDDNVKLRQTLTEKNSEIEELKKRPTVDYVEKLKRDVIEERESSQRLKKNNSAPIYDGYTLL